MSLQSQPISGRYILVIPNLSSITWSILKYIQPQYSKSIKCMHLNRTGVTVKGRYWNRLTHNKRACRNKKKIKKITLGKACLQMLHNEKEMFGFSCSSGFIPFTFIFLYQYNVRMICTARGQRSWVEAALQDSCKKTSGSRTTAMNNNEAEQQQ